MDNMSYVRKFSKNLFWDVSTDTIDMEKNAPYVVQRILEYGRISDWEALRNYYGVSRIAEISKKLRTLEPHALSFISVVSHIPKEQFRCCTMKQLKTRL